MKALLYLSLYVGSIVAANVLTAHTAPLVLGAFIVTAGTWFIAATFPLRDAVQLHAGRRIAYAAIAIALAASALTSHQLGDTLAITYASAIAFAVSETIDAETFTRIRGRVAKRVAISGLIASPIDSVLFAVIGLSPIGAGFVAWSDIWRVIVARIVVKAIVQVAVAPVARRVMLAPAGAVA